MNNFIELNLRDSKTSLTEVDHTPYLTHLKAMKTKATGSIKRFRFRIEPHPVMKEEYPQPYYKFRSEKVAKAFFSESLGKEIKVPHNFTFAIKTIICLLLLTISTAINAQSLKYELYQCNASQYRTFDTNWSSWTSSVNTDFIIRLCVDESRIEFNNKRKTVIYMVNAIDKQSGIDDDGDKYTIVIWTAYDESGLKCNLTSIDYPSLSNRNFMIQYSDTEIFFQCKIINLPANTTNM